MSASLYWRPDGPPTGYALPDQLRMLLERRYSSGEMHLTESEWGGYFKGLCDAGVPGAKAVVDALAEHRSIVLEWRY